MRFVTALVAGFVLTGPAAAETAEISSERLTVLACLEAMGGETVWAQCVSLLFAPCADNTVGSDAHVACLGAEHKVWTRAMDGQVNALHQELTTAGATELGQIMGQWIGYVAQNCASVAAERAGAGERAVVAARLGCEISEIAGVTGEFVACREGRSTAPYCIIQE